MRSTRFRADATNRNATQFHRGAAREAARRMQCQNNMKQIGLTIHNFESAYRFFPPARVDAAPGFPVTEFGVPAPATGTIQHGPGIFLLPYMEQTAVYNLYDFR